MISANLHPDEEQRIQELIRYEVLDSEQEEVFNEITELASAICKTPISLISLVDRDRQWFKASVGLDASQTERNIAFCSHAILQDKVFEIQNALEDSRFSDNPLVTDSPDIRFYAGAPLIAPNGFPLGTLCVIDTEPKKLTDEQRRALEILSKQVISQLEVRVRNRYLRKINEEKEILFTTIAHDLKSPFNGILNLTKMLVRKSDQLEPEKIATIAQHILSSSMDVYQVLDELLQWAQQRMGGMTCSAEKINIKDIVQDTIHLLENTLSLKNIDASEDISTTLDAIGDPTLFKSVVRNLLNNAIKFTPEEGTITLSAWEKNDYVELAITDSGKGIDPVIRDKLFATSGTSLDGTAGEKGTGLGLNLCSEFMHLQKGKIYIDENSTQGTKFVCALPKSA